MSECHRFREMTIETDPGNDERVRRHAARCSDCQQLEAERELRELFRGVGSPGPLFTSTGCCGNGCVRKESVSSATNGACS